jgi:hypothetical protein
MGLLELSELSGLGDPNSLFARQQEREHSYQMYRAQVDREARERQQRGRPRRAPAIPDQGHLPYGATVRVFDVRTMRWRTRPIAGTSPQAEGLTALARARIAAWHRSRQAHRAAAAWAASRRRNMQTPTRIQVPAAHQAVAARRTGEIRSQVIATRPRPAGIEAVPRAVGAGVTLFETLIDKFRMAPAISVPVAPATPRYAYTAGPRLPAPTPYPAGPAPRPTGMYQ